jgi:cation diffusion facilitator CzcD-associated flavoprotein CzcO
VTDHVDVIVIGAGPYGLATTAFLRHAGAKVQTVGEPMSSWRSAMPPGMLLRSRPRSSHIADPQRRLGLDDWAAATGRTCGNPVRLEEFADYGRWFQQRVAPQLITEKVRNLRRVSNSFQVELEDERVLRSDRIVLTSGILPFAHRPETFGALPEDRVTHSLDHGPIEELTGKRVLVVGGGQSALEGAALLKEAGASPEVVARAPSLTWLPPERERWSRGDLVSRLLPPTDVGGRVSGWLAATPGVFHRLPPRSQAWVMRKCTVPAGSHWLRDRLVEVPLRTRREVVGAGMEGDCVEVTFADGERLITDHVMLCTGYRIDVTRMPFLDRTVLDRLELSDGAPLLRDGLESSLPGLHFAGAAAVRSFGPIMRFVVGTWYAAPAIARRMTGAPLRPRHVAYRPRPHRTGARIPGSTAANQSMTGEAGA